MADFLLLHGAWHGAWCWERVVGILEAAGHRTVVPCLPGLGERAAETGAGEVDLSTHAAAVCEAVEEHRGEPLVAVAHSYGGAVLLAAGEGCGDRIGGRVFLDAVLVEDGEAVMDLVPPELAAQRIVGARAAGGWMAPPPAGALGLLHPGDVAFAEARLTPQPLVTYLEPARLPGPPGAGPPAVYVACTEPPYPPVARSRERARRYGWPVVALEAGHDAMISHPELTAQRLVLLARELRGRQPPGGKPPTAPTAPPTP